MTLAERLRSCDPHRVSDPRRFQRRRGRGSRISAGAVYVGRPTVWGNPFRITRSSDFHGLPGSWFVLDGGGIKHHPEENTERAARQLAVDLYAQRVAAGRDGFPSEARIRSDLTGLDLACWCPAGEPCHADVLLRIANGTTRSATRVDGSTGAAQSAPPSPPG